MSDHQWTIHRTTRLPWCSVCGTGIIQSTFCGGAPEAPVHDLAWYQMAYPKACDALDAERAEVRRLRADLKIAESRKSAVIQRLAAFARDCQDNWDCDIDAHTHGTTCRACEATRVLTWDEDCRESNKGIE